MRELALSARTQAIFDRIKSYAWTLNVYGMSSSRAEWLVKARTRARIHKAGVVPPYTNVYRRYVSELIRVFRSETGERLIAGIKLTMRKWVNFGLDQALLEGLLSDCFLRFEQQGYAMPKAKKLGKSEAVIAKSYLLPEELNALNRIVTTYLELAELQAMNRRPMYMRDWIAKLNEFLSLSGREILKHAGTISHEEAVRKAELEFEKFHHAQIEETSQVERDFEAAVKGLKKLPGPSRKKTKT